jgi:hypothetical protein
MIDIDCPHGDSSSTTMQEPLRKRIKTELSSGSSSSACCSWQGLYKDLSQHLDYDCDLAVCNGPMQGCSEKVKQKNLPDHQRDCRHRPMTCHRCGIIYQTILAESHEKVCPEVEIVCSKIEVRNDTTVDKCKQKYKRKDRALHKSVCNLVNMHCVYASFGCRTWILRKYMNQHLVDEAISHTGMPVSKVLSHSGKQVAWTVDCPLPAGASFLKSKNMIISGEYRCCLKATRNE